jgi:hypothetical protein
MSQPPHAMCMPILRAPVELTGSIFEKAWREVWPKSSRPGHVDAKENTITCRVDGAHVAAAVMPIPIPNDELAGPATTSLLWPNAQQDLAGYGAHVVVFISGADSNVAAFQIMTRVAAAVVHGTKAIGVYVGGAGMLVKADVFMELALEPDLQLALWIDFRCFHSQADQTGLYTVGMAQLDHLEIEVPASQRECGDLRIWTMNFASWLIESGTTINSGETVGLSETEQILVDHAESVVGRDGPVMRLTGL